MVSVGERVEVESEKMVLRGQECVEDVYVEDVSGLGRRRRRCSRREMADGVRVGWIRDWKV